MLPRATRQRKTIDPCAGCGLHRSRCLCAIVPRIEVSTWLTLVIHVKELKRTTNTGRLALRALANSDMYIRGEKSVESVHSPSLSSHFRREYTPLLFFPSDDAVDLTLDLVAKLQKPIQLFVPDGNWRQASKVLTRHVEFRDVLKVKISRSNEARDHLRAEHMREGMSTLEAIARAMGVLENRDVELALLQLYHEKLRRTLEGRGTI